MLILSVIIYVINFFDMWKAYVTILNPLQLLFQANNFENNFFAIILVIKNLFWTKSLQNSSRVLNYSISIEYLILNCYLLNSLF